MRENVVPREQIQDRAAEPVRAGAGPRSGRFARRCGRSFCTCPLPPGAGSSPSSSTIRSFVSMDDPPLMPANPLPARGGGKRRRFSGRDRRPAAPAGGRGKPPGDARPPLRAAGGTACRPCAGSGRGVSACLVATTSVRAPYAASTGRDSHVQRRSAAGVFPRRTAPPPRRPCRRCCARPRARAAPSAPAAPAAARPRA